MKIICILAAIVAIALIALFAYTVIEVIIERYRFRKRLLPDDECTVLRYRDGKGAWFDNATVLSIDHEKGKVSVATEKESLTVPLTQIYPPFQFKNEKKLMSHA